MDEIIKKQTKERAKTRIQKQIKTDHPDNLKSSETSYPDNQKQITKQSNIKTIIRTKTFKTR